MLLFINASLLLRRRSTSLGRFASTLESPSPAGLADIAVARYDTGALAADCAGSTEALAWSYTPSSATAEGVNAMAVVADAVYIGGFFSGTLEFGMGDQSLSAGATQNGFLA